MVVLFWRKIFLIMSFKQHIALLNDSLPKEDDLEILNIVCAELAKEIVNAAHENKLTLIFGNGAISKKLQELIVGDYEFDGYGFGLVLFLKRNN